MVQGRRGGRRSYRAADSAHLDAGRHHHRRRQRALWRQHPPHAHTWRARACCFIGTGVLRRRGRRANGSVNHAGRFERGLGSRSRPIFQGIAARVEDGTPCCEWVGADGAGHFVKMVHNGIEYGDMQLICEAYQIMKQLLGMSTAEMHARLCRLEQG